MRKLNRRKKQIQTLLKKEGENIKIFFSYQSYSEGYDPYEDNTTENNLNAITIKGYVTQLQPTSLVWKEYGLKEQGAVQVLCDAKYKKHFRNCNLIKINGDKYQVFKEGTGNRSIIIERPNNLIRITLQRVE